MGKPRLEPLPTVDFKCQDCGHEFTRAPSLTEDDPDRPWHPYYYIAPCPRTDCPNPAAEQDPQQRSLLKAWAHATGPKTPEGKAASAANLEGHPTPEETKITRLNALKHGAFARTANYFPARPGTYASCTVCEHYGNTCIKDPPSGHKNPIGCYKRAEIFVQYQIAIDAGDPSILRSFFADNQAAIQSVLNEMLLQMAIDGGPRVKEPAWYHDKDGGFHLAQYKDENGDYVQLYELKAHPLAKLIMEYMDKNDLTLADMGMTPKVQQEQELLSGHLASDHASQEKADEYRQRQLDNAEMLKGFILNAQKRLEKDPVAIEHMQSDDDG